MRIVEWFEDHYRGTRGPFGWLVRWRDLRELKRLVQWVRHTTRGR